MSTIIVTGGYGYKGSVLVPQLLQAGHNVHIIDTCWFGSHYPIWEYPCTADKTDIRDLKSLPKADALIHLAAVANDPCAELNSKLAWEVNVLGTQHLLDLCKASGIKRFIYASSGSVYGISDREHVTEETPLIPISDYNKTKMVAERVVMSYGPDILWTILRPATVNGYSPRMRFDLAVNALAASAWMDKQITVDGNGAQIRPTVYIQDICRAYVWALKNPAKAGYQIFNVGGQNMTLHDIATKIQQRTRAPIRYTPGNDPRSYRLDSTKIINAGFAFKDASIDTGLSELQHRFEVEALQPTDQNYNVRWMKQCNIK